MRDLLLELRDKYDHILMDTPPTLSVTDAVVLSQRVGAIILVIRANKTTKQVLRRSRDILMQVNARITGVLLNAVDLTSPDYYYYAWTIDQDGMWMFAKKPILGWAWVRFPRA